MEYWDLETKCSHPFPEVGVEFKASSVVYYKGTNVTPANSTVLFTWSRDTKMASSTSRNLGSAPFLQQPKIWAVVGSSRTYVPSKDDVGHSLRLVSYAINHMGVQMSSTIVVISSPVRPFSPSPRRIIRTLSGLKRLGKPQPVFKNGGFKVVSYNLLADVYVKKGRDQYDHCPLEKLSWEYRKVNLLKEILSYEADILCLQEVQSDHFKNLFDPELARYGYLSIYKRKRNDLYNGKNYVKDGCATFFRGDKFRLVKKYEVEYEKMALGMVSRLESGQRNEGMSRLMKDNVATAVILEETTHYRSRICVANTHLHGGKGVSDVRLFQVVSLIRGLQEIDSLGIPVIVCGDMNSAPGSDTHTFLVNGKVGYLRQEKRDVLGISKYLQLNHSMHLANAYSGASDAHQDETLDYILYSENKLKVDGVLEIPFYECRGKTRLLPTPQWSSDHIALVANLRVKRAYRVPNYSELPINPWEEQAKEVKSLKVKQQAFRESQVKFDSKNGILGMLDKLTIGGNQIQKYLCIRSVEFTSTSS